METSLKLKIYLLTNGRQSYNNSLHSLQELENRTEDIVVIKNKLWLDAHHECEKCSDPFFLRVDDDFVLHPKSLLFMKNILFNYPDLNKVGLMCWYLWDPPRSMPIQGIKIYNTKAMRAIGGTQADALGRTDQVTNKLLIKHGFRVVRTDKLSVVGIHVCGSWEELLHYEKLWSLGGKGLQYRKEGRELIKAYCDSGHSLEEQSVLRLNFLEELNKKNKSHFYKYLLKVSKK